MQAICSSMDLQSPPFYHCVSRDFYRSYLGNEEYQLRCEWLEQCLQKLTGIFAVDIAAYTVLANHYHVVLYCNDDKLKMLTLRQVIERWHQLFEGTPLSRRYLSGDVLEDEPMQALLATVNLWQRRLGDVSWFMRILNDAIMDEIGDQGAADFVYAPVAVYPKTA